MSLVIEALRNRASMESIRVLMERPDFEIDCQAYGGCGITPLIAAFGMCREDVALELIRLGADVELSDQMDHSPLSLACKFNLHSTAEALVQAGADINRPSFLTIFIPLGSAATNGHVSMVQKLLLWGSNPGQVGSLLGDTVRAETNKLGHYGVVQLLDAWGSIQTVWVVRSAGQVRRLGTRSALKSLPKDLCRMVGSMLA
jgi:hypothetical protein